MDPKEPNPDLQAAFGEGVTEAIECLVTDSLVTIPHDILDSSLNLAFTALVFAKSVREIGGCCDEHRKGIAEPEDCPSNVLTLDANGFLNAIREAKIKIPRDMLDLAKEVAEILKRAPPAAGWASPFHQETP